MFVNYPEFVGQDAIWHLLCLERSLGLYKMPDCLTGLVAAISVMNKSDFIIG